MSQTSVGTSSEPVTGATEGDWAEYTPALLNENDDADVGNGIIQGRYRVNGAMVDVMIQLNFGTTTTFGTAAPAFGFPDGIEPALSKMFANGIPQSQWSVGLDATGPAGFPLFVAGTFAAGSLAPDTPAIIELFGVGNAIIVDATHPFTWADGDLLIVGFSVPWQPVPPT